MKKIKKLLSLRFLLAVLLFALLIPTKNFSNQERASLLMKPTEIHAAVDPAEVLSTKLIGPFRSFANITVWLRAIEYEAQGEFFELNTLYKLALNMQPRNPDVWGYLSDLFVYRISRKMSNVEQRWRSITEGYKILEDGLRKMPNSSELRNKYAIFYQMMTGEMPVQIISQDLEREKSLLGIVPAWFEEGQQLLAEIDALSVDERKRLDNFCLNFGTAMTYGSEYKNLSQFNLMAVETREVVARINLIRAKFAFLAYYQALSELGPRPYVFRHAMFRALGVLELDASEVHIVWALSRELVQEIAKIDFTQLSNLHQTVYVKALEDFEIIETFKNQLESN